MPNFSYIFFGTSEFSVHVLNALAPHFLPTAVVTFSDKPKGRKLVLTPNPVKTWAIEHAVPVIEVTTFKDEAVLAQLKALKADVFVVASFGKILPDSVIYMPQGKTLNVHPSLLPKLRGPAPIQGAIMEEQETGVTIMRLDSKMDEGPIVAQRKAELSTWPIPYSEAEKMLGNIGGTLLAEVMPQWVQGELPEIEQNHIHATYTKKLTKEDADVSQDPAEAAYRKILAYEVWPRARLGDLIITKAHIEDGNLVIDRIIPPGKKEIEYKEYLRNIKI